MVARNLVFVLILLIIFVPFAWAEGSMPPNIKITEFMVLNENVISDERGVYSSWIEITNLEDQPINIGGFYISDLKEDPLRYKFPVDFPNLTTIPPGQAIILWADATPNLGPLHLSFKLSPTAENVILRWKDKKTILDAVEYGKQVNSISYGRRHLSEDWAFFADPTPGNPNLTKGFSESKPALGALFYNNNKSFILGVIASIIGLTVIIIILLHSIRCRKNAEVALHNKNEELGTYNEELIATNEQLTAIEEELRHQFEELERNRISLQLANRKLFDIIEFLPDATFVIDEKNKVFAWNRAIEEMTGISKQEIVGKGDYLYAVPFYGEPKPMLVDLIEADDKEIERYYNNLERKGNALFGEAYVPSFFQGKSAFLWMAASILYDDYGSNVGAIQSIRDITERKETEEQLRRLSLYDTLTGLYNRTYFEQEMKRLEDGRHAPVGIIVCDVDGLKLVNDTLGHDSGDILLKVAADTIKSCFRESDVVARIGGDEFAALLPCSDNQVVENAANRIRAAIKRYNSEDQSFGLNLSVGLSVSSDAEVNMGELFKDADNAMYREKLHHGQSSRRAVIETLMKALEARDFITEGHTDRLEELVVSLALSLGLAESRMSDLQLLAQFHDIGKVGIPDHILFKSSPLTDKEYAVMQRHSEIGHRIAQSAPDLAPIADWILKHHEFWDGSGYPLGLKEEEIPLECRILGIADAYDAMTSERPYRNPLSHERAVAELKKCAGKQFDPRLVNVFVNVQNKCSG
ncbi:MAG: diguanylate cyclase [Firmicutes bacterium]|nr:diguanylate cyclase [Bacillota bacterium]